MPRHHREKDLAVAVELAAADAGDEGERGAVARAAAHHLQERRVVEDDIGRHALLAREIEPLRTQRLPQRLVGRRDGHRRRDAGERPLAPLRRLRLARIIAAEGNRRLAAQHGGRALAQMQAAMAFDIDFEMALGHELAEDRLPFLLVELGADAEGLEPVMTELPHTLRKLAAQHVDEMGDAEALPGAEDGRERLLRRDEPVPNARGTETIVAIPARRMVALAEISEQHLAPAGRGLAISQERVELVPLDAALPLV